MKRIDLSRYAPVGRKSSQMLQGGYFALGVACIYTLSMLGNYVSARNELYEIVPPVRALYPNRVLIPGAKIAPFMSIVDDGLRFFPLFWLFMGLEVIAAYLYHRKDTMSIYLMRRLPDKWELHRRCWGKPLILTAASFLIMGALLLFYFVIYLVFTPAECLPF